MKTIESIIEKGLKENQEELKENLLELKSTKELYEKNNNFDFNISMFYDLKINLLIIKYTFKKDEHEITIEFQMTEPIFYLNAINISTVLMQYAINYFNNEDFKINIGDYYGDHFVGIKEFIESFYDEDEISNTSILDKTLRKVIL